MAEEMYPLRVELNEQKVLRLARIFLQIRAEIEEEILSATDFGVANRKSIIAQIDGILLGLSDQVGIVIAEEVSNYYEMGLEQALKQLRNVGADVGIAEGFNRIHQEAIAAIVDDTSRAFAEAMTGVARNARTLLGKATREQITMSIAKGLVGGDAMRDVKNAIKAIIREQGIVSLRDRAGRAWTLDRYAEMLFRTKMVEARNRGMMNRIAEFDYDLVQVSDHVGECELCRSWEGRVLSITGKTTGFPTVAEAESKGLFHPNCRHAINVLIPSLARQTKAYYPEEKTRIVSKAEIEKATKLELPNLPR